MDVHELKTLVAALDKKIKEAEALRQSTFEIYAAIGGKKGEEGNKELHQIAEKMTRSQKMLEAEATKVLQRAAMESYQMDLATEIRIFLDLHATKNPNKTAEDDPKYTCPEADKMEAFAAVLEKGGRFLQHANTPVISEMHSSFARSPKELMERVKAFHAFFKTQ